MAALMLLCACVPAGRAASDDGLTSHRQTGWSATTPEERAEVRAFSRAYVEALRGCATPRRTAQTLVGLAVQKGFQPLPERLTPTPGTRYLTRIRDVDFAAVVMGRRPPTEGFDVVVAEMGSPRIDLKPQATYARSGFLLFDTHLVGEIDLRAWLTHPLALYGYVVRAEGEPAEIAIGADPADPVFVIPDLLPHLAAHAQAERIVDAEGLDAIAASTETGDGTEEERLARTLHQVLEARYHLGPDAFEHGELTLVPATAPAFLGVDQGLVGAYGQTQAANLFAAMHALSGVPERTAVVIGVERTGSSAAGPVLPLVLGRILSAASGEPVPERTLRAALSRSRVLAASNVGGVVGQGFAVNARHADALPGYVRQVIDSFDSAGAQIQLVSSGGGWDSPSRDLGALELDSLDVSIPIAGRTAPMQILSTLDLWSAYRADWGFFGMRTAD